MMKKIVFILAIFICTFTSSAQQSTATWKKWKFLMGDWEGVGSGKPGEGTGYFSFKPDLDSNVLIRKNHTEYPATISRRSSVHDDILIIYPDTSGNPVKAIYFDNEGHVINYKIDYFDTSIILTSTDEKSLYIFRLSYFPNDDKTVTIKFEMASSEYPAKFNTYLEGKAAKKD